jgi:hypothetical protein
MKNSKDDVQIVVLVEKNFKGMIISFGKSE